MSAEQLRRAMLLLPYKKPCCSWPPRVCCHTLTTDWLPAPLRTRQYYNLVERLTGLGENSPPHTHNTLALIQNPVQLQGNVFQHSSNFRELAYFRIGLVGRPTEWVETPTLTQCPRFGEEDSLTRVSKLQFKTKTDTGLGSQRRLQANRAQFLH